MNIDFAGSASKRSLAHSNDGVPILATPALIKAVPPLLSSAIRVVLPDRPEDKDKLAEPCSRDICDKLRDILQLRFEGLRPGGNKPALCIGGLRSVPNESPDCLETRTPHSSKLAGYNRAKLRLLILRYDAALAQWPVAHSVALAQSFFIETVVRVVDS